MERHVARHFRPALVRIYQRPTTTACLSRDSMTTKVVRSQNLRPPASKASFHTTRIRLATEAPPDHYGALELSFSASAADIKRYSTFSFGSKNLTLVIYMLSTHDPKFIAQIQIDVIVFYLDSQFYLLSKRHHPDHNRDDPAASDRFIRINEAYHVLSTPDRRTKYDRDLARHRPWPANSASPTSYSGTATGSGGGRRRHGSYASSSASGPAGGRPASGLSKRRTQFRGPPPSFYSAGAWGVHGAKRAAYAPGAATGAGTSSSNRGEGSAAHAGGRNRGPRRGNNPDSAHNHAFGTGSASGSASGAGAASSYNDADLWYWDKEGHFRTQHSVEQHIRRNSSDRPEHKYEPGRPSDPAVNFLMVSGVLGLAIGIPAYYIERNSKLKV